VAILFCIISLVTFFEELVVAGGAQEILEGGLTKKWM
jgi:hypothetical protein